MGELQVPTIVETLKDCDAKAATVYLEVMKVLESYPWDEDLLETA